MTHDLVTGEADRYPGAPHPRERGVLLGHTAAERSFLDLVRAGRLHHAWLVGGPEGIGKATFAYRAARFLLAEGPDPERLTQARDLSVAPGTHVFRQVAALSHPDLAVIRRTPASDKKGPSALIPVDAVREALAMFGRTAGSGGYRVVIVDCAEDLNLNGANALLKMLEEPPARAVFFIVSHNPGRLLPTIRSRCRTLPLRPLAREAVVEVVHGLGPPWSQVDPAVLGAAAASADGSVRSALRRATPETAALIESVTELLAALPGTATSAVLGLSETLNGRDAAEDFELFVDVVQRWVSARIGEEAAGGAARLAPFVEVWDKFAAGAREVETFNLDRRPLILSLFGDLSEATRRSMRAA